MVLNAEEQSLGAFNNVQYTNVQTYNGHCFRQLVCTCSNDENLWSRLNQQNICFPSTRSTYQMVATQRNVHFNNGFCFNCHNSQWLSIFQFACDDALNTLWLMMSQMINGRPSHWWFVLNNSSRTLEPQSTERNEESIENPHKPFSKWLWSIVLFVFENSLNRVHWQSNKQITKWNNTKHKRQNVSIHCYIIVPLVWRIHKFLT